MSSAAAKSRPVGAAGAVVSTVMVSAADAAPTLPAVSVAFAVMERAPAASVTSRLNAPVVACAVVVPSEVGPSNNSTVESISAVPVIVTLCLLVRSSIGDAPVSSAVIKSRLIGAAGATVSMSTDRVAWPLMFPAVSVCVAVIKLTPSPGKAVLK